MSGAILLTGATGFLGMETLARLIERDEQQIFVLVRAQDRQGAKRRLADLMGRLYEASPAVGTRVQAVRGDMLEPGLGISGEDRWLLIESVDRIVHCAASISFEMPLQVARAINVDGVSRMLELARAIAHDGSLRRIVHVSTAYVSGRRSGLVGEAERSDAPDFRNTYERSKHEAECLVRQATDLPSVIARPSMVVGHRMSGWTPAFNVIYWPIRAAERGLLTELPARADSIVDFVPVDYVADALIALLEDPSAGDTYHLAAGADAMTAGELVKLHSLVSGRDPVRLVAQASTADALSATAAYAPYFDVRCSFDDARARSALGRAGVHKPHPTEYLGQLLAYAHATRWGKRPMSREAAMTLAAGP